MATVRFEQRLFRRVTYNAETGCWEWTGTRNWRGYAKATVNYRTVSVHRWVYEFFRGAVPLGLQLDHLCRVKHCVNPAHLEPVTNAVNTARGRGTTLDRCPRGHNLTAANCYLRSDTGFIECRECKNERQRQYKARTSAPR